MTVTPDTRLERVIETLQAHQLHTIPVVDRFNRFLGITGYRHMMKAFLDNHRSWKEGTVTDAMEPIRPLTVFSGF
nr:CBS domain-containing protein [Polycladomyces sp. WAk]